MLMKNAAIEAASLISLLLKEAQNAWVQMTAEAKWTRSFHYAAGQARCEKFKRLSDMYTFLAVVFKLQAP